LSDEKCVIRIASMCMHIFALAESRVFAK